MNRDQVGRFAGFFVLVNMDSLSSSHTCGVASNAARSIAVIRSLMPNTISRFTSARIAAAISSNVVKPGNSSYWEISVSSATLIRSGGGVASGRRCSW